MHPTTHLLSRCLLVVFALFGTSVSGLAATRTVCSSGCTYVTIQSAVVAANPGDEVRLTDTYHTEGGIVVDKNLVLSGDPASPATLQAAATPGVAVDRVLRILPNAIVTIRDLVIRHGNPTGEGGAIDNEGILLVERVDVVNNQSTYIGGGISTTGPLEIRDSLISGNESGNVGGGVACWDQCSQLLVSGSTIEANTSFDRGGGVYSAAPLTVTDSTVMGNFADSSSYGQGGGIYHTDSALILRTDILDNRADVTGGAIASSGPLTLVDAWVQGNQVNGGPQAKGGGLFVVSSGTTIIHSSHILDNSTSGDGGGIFFDGGSLSIYDTAIAGNLCSLNGGGINHSGSAATAAGLEISGNVAQDGGGVWIAGSSDLSLRSSTVSGNQASDEGGGLMVKTCAILELSNVTITQNEADPLAQGGIDGGGLFVESGCPATDTVRVRNSIIAGNLDPTPLILFTAPDCAGPIASDGFIHIGTTGLNGMGPACVVTGSTSGLDVGGDPGLGPLMDNGGPTWTHALLPGSLNLDAGDALGCVDEFRTPLTHDQRGAQRPDRCDRGAFEAGGDLPMFRDNFEPGGPWRWSSATP